jgi:hypothetical protein
VEVQVDRVLVASGIEAPGAESVGLLTWGVSAAFDGMGITSLAGR